MFFIHLLFLERREAEDLMKSLLMIMVILSPLSLP
jgi:hypothetical protein